MEFLIGLTIFLGWYIVGYFGFLILIWHIHDEVDAEDVMFGFLFAIIGPIILLGFPIYWIALLLHKLDADSIAKVFNNTLNNLKR